MTTIYKYPLELTNRQTVEMPEDSRILAFQEQGTHPIIWAQVDDSLPKVKREFQIFATGEEMEEPDPFRDRTYIGTIQRGIYVWHLYELIP